MIHRLARGLLGRHIVWRTDEHPGACQVLRLGCGLGNAKVGQCGLVVLAHKNIGRLDVAVDKALLVGVIECVRYLLDDARRPSRRQRPFLLD